MCWAHSPSSTLGARACSGEQDWEGGSAWEKHVFLALLCFYSPTQAQKNIGLQRGVGLKIESESITCLWDFLRWTLTLTKKKNVVEKSSFLAKTGEQLSAAPEPAQHLRKVLCASWEDWENQPTAWAGVCWGPHCSVATNDSQNGGILKCYHFISKILKKCSPFKVRTQTTSPCTCALSVPTRCVHILDEPKHHRKGLLETQIPWASCLHPH